MGEMKNFFLIMVLILSFQGRAQEDLEAREIQEFGSLNVWLPFQVGLDGNISFLKAHPAESFVFSPIIQIGVQWKKGRFQIPERDSGLVLVRNENPDEWLEVYRRRLSLGSGLGVLIKKGVKLGLVPYKGSKQRLVRQVKAGAPSPGISLLPKSLDEIAQWETGDQGSFETFGGVQFQLSASSGLIDIASASLELQNEFLLQIKKISTEEVKIGVFEGSSKRRKFSVGPLLANFSVGKFSGKRLGAEFILNIARDESLFQSALKGKLALLQQKLPHIAQKLSFYGHSRTTFFGVPEIMGKNIRKGEMNMEDNGDQSSMVFRTRKNDGILLPRRDIHRFTYLSQNETVLFWANEMSKVKGKILDKYFLSIGRRMGLEDFDQKIQKDEKFGNVMTQLGISIKNSEITSFQNIPLSALSENYRERCEELRLNCRKEGRRKKVLREYLQVMKLDLENLRKGLGKLLMKNPSLIHSLYKTLGLRNEAYYLFLSDRFRSLEGKAEVLF